MEGNPMPGQPEADHALTVINNSDLLPTGDEHLSGGGGQEILGQDVAHELAGLIMGYDHY
jgi:hypothetical protein